MPVAGVGRAPVQLHGHCVIVHARDESVIFGLGLRSPGGPLSVWPYLLQSYVDCNREGLALRKFG